MQNDAIIKELTQQLLNYDAKTGVFTWRQDRGNGRIKRGARAGSKRTDGYREIRINRRPLMEHRIAWFLCHGELPECQLDHINRIRDDNRLENLRIAPENATHNNQNRKVGRNNTSGCKGVMWDKRLNKWIVRLKSKGRSLYFGVYASFDDAVTARIAAEHRYHVFANPR